MEEKVKEGQNKLKEQFSSIEYVALAFDFWSSPMNDSYVAVSYFFITDHFELKHGLLDFEFFRGS